MGRARNTVLLKKMGKRIKQLREQRAITQEIFNFDTGINIGRIESAKRDFSITTLSAICDYLEISIEDFFMGMK